MFFFTLAVDTFFSQTLIQMIVLGKILNIISNRINAVDKFPGRNQVQQQRGLDQGTRQNMHLSTHYLTCLLGILRNRTCANLFEE